MYCMYERKANPGADPEAADPAAGAAGDSEPKGSVLLDSNVPIFRLFYNPAKQNKVQKHIVFRLLFNCTGKTMKNRETITSVF